MLRSASETLGFIKPELPTLVPEPPTGEGWIHEIKYDGYRTLIVIDRGQVRAFTRNGNDWTRAYRRVVDACCKLKCESALIDGEMVVQDEHGITDFYALRSAIYTAPHRNALFAFDLLHFNRQDLRGCPLLERRALLASRLPLAKPWTAEPMPSGYQVIDANGVVLAHVHGQPDGAIAVSDTRLTTDEPRRNRLSLHMG